MPPEEQKNFLADAILHALANRKRGDESLPEPSKPVESGPHDGLPKVGEARTVIPFRQEERQGTNASMGTPTPPSASEPKHPGPAPERIDAPRRDSEQT